MRRILNYHAPPPHDEQGAIGCLVVMLIGWLAVVCVGFVGSGA